MTKTHENIKQIIDKKYEQGEPLINDDMYDSIFGVDATSLSTLNDVEHQKLPVWMGSLDKIKNEAELERWLKKYTCSSFIISSKLDGCSAIFTNQKELFSRGNGFSGTNWTKALQFINKKIVHDTINKLGQHSHVRCEIVMKKKIFEEKYTSFKNQRNMVAGQLSCKNFNSLILNDIDLIPYEIILMSSEHETTSSKAQIPLKQLSPQDQMKILYHNDKEKFLCWELVERKNLTINFLSNLLNTWTEICSYSIDGLVITANIPYERNIHGNPSYSIAYKQYNLLKQKITTVKKIVWNKSIWGSLIPVVYIDPIILDGVTISKVSGYNAKYIEKEKIGPGAVVVCTRSGDVIPKIVKVVHPSEFISLPEGNWEGVNIVDKDGGCPIKLLHQLLKKFDVKNVGIKTIEKFFHHGITDLFSLLDAPKNLECFKGKQGEKIYNSIQQLLHQLHSLPIIISASGVFSKSIGQKSLEKLVEHFDLFGDEIPSLKQLVRINGFSIQTAQQIIDNYSTMKQFLNKCIDYGIKFSHENELTTKQSEINIMNPGVINIVGTLKTCAVLMDKKKICVSGFRDENLSKKFIVCDHLTKDCTMLVVKDLNKETSKTKLAQSWNIPIILRDHV